MAPPTRTDRVDLGGGRSLTVERPADPEALLDEDAFARDEFLPYWAELWASGVALAREVAAAPLRGRRVVELGCGLGLPSVAAALAGAATVLATDWSPEAVAAAARNAALNGVTVRAAVVDWRDAEALVAEGPFDLVLAADVLYEARNAEPLGGLLDRLAPAEVWLADPGRAAADGFLTARPPAATRSLGGRVALHRWGGGRRPGGYLLAK